MAQEGFKRKISAIFSADAKGYSHLMGEDEEATVRTLTTYREIISTLVIDHKGRVVDSPGDNILAEFASVVDALRCAWDIQQEIKSRNTDLPENRRMNFRIGINLGDVIEEGDRIYGDGVNIAARIEGLAGEGGICISGTAYDQVKNKLPYRYKYQGEQTVKNIKEPVRVYQVTTESLDETAELAFAKKNKLKPWLWLASTITVVLFVGIIITLFFSESKPKKEAITAEKIANSSLDKPSIAVLPFENLSDDPEQEYFADGMTDELITHLSKISGLLVISRNSSFTYKGKLVKVQQVADELNVQYVLEGSIQRAGDRVRIRAQLIDGATDHHLWAESYDAVMENIFDLQDEITKKITAVLAVKLTVREQNRFAKKKTTNIEAYDAFVKGWEHLHRETPDDLDQAISYLKQAIELDPNYSRAHATLAWTYLWNSSLGFPAMWRRTTLSRLMARKYLELAMRNPTSAAHLVTSKMAMFRRRYEDAVTHAQLALAFDPNDPDANLNMAEVLAYTGKPKEALEFVNKTIQLGPRNMADPLFTAGLAYFSMGDLQKAAKMMERALKHNPTTFARYGWLAAIYALLDRDEDAQAAYDKFLKVVGISNFALDLTERMSWAPIKDRHVADRYAVGLVKAGNPGRPSEYYKIYEKNRLTGEEIKNLVSGQEITVFWNWKTFWVDHSENGRLIYKGIKGKWWIEDDMLCYQRESGIAEGLKDCGEVYRNPDATPGSNNQYLHVKDYGIYAFTAEE